MALADGAFRFDGLARGSYALAVRSDRTALAFRNGVHVDAGGVVELVFELRAPATGTVRVLEKPSEQPVANARVRFVPLTDEMRANRIDGDVIRGHASFRVRLTARVEDDAWVFTGATLETRTPRPR